MISLGVTADSYIVFFERFKDEVHAGKSPRSAVAPAFKRSYRTIVAADIVTALAAVVLYLTAISSVRGFALTLGVARPARPVRRVLLQAPDGVPARAQRAARVDARLRRGERRGRGRAGPRGRGRLGVSGRHAFRVFRGYEAPNFDLVRAEPLVLVSGVVLVLCAGRSPIWQFNLSIDFTGGALIQFENRSDVSVEDVRDSWRTTRTAATVPRSSSSAGTGSRSGRRR